jgi:dCMP deaminase
MNRASWSEYALSLARTASTRSEDPYQKVGACALAHDNKVLGLGYNGLAPAKDVEKSFWKDRDARRPYMIHAEANCLSLFEAGKCNLLAVTLLPCSYCATMIAAYGIPNVVYNEVYNRDTAALEIFKFYNIKLEKIAL